MISQKWTFDDICMEGLHPEYRQKLVKKLVQRFLEFSSFLDKEFHFFPRSSQGKKNQGKWHAYSSLHLYDDGWWRHLQFNWRNWKGQGTSSSGHWRIWRYTIFGNLLICKYPDSIIILTRKWYFESIKICICKKYRLITETHFTNTNLTYRWSYIQCSWVCWTPQRRFFGEFGIDWNFRWIL